MLGDANQAKLASVLARLDAVLEGAPSRLDTMQAELRQTLAASRSAAESIAAAGAALTARAEDPKVTEAVDRLSSTLRAAESAVAGLGRIEHRLAGLIDTADAVVGSARAPVMEVLSSMRTALAEARVFVRQLRIAPSSLVFGSSAQPLDTHRPAAPASRARPPR